MRGTVWAIVLAGWIPACAEKGDGMAAENVLELQLGGGYESLSEALQRPLRGAKRLPHAGEEPGPGTQPADPRPQTTTTDPPKREPTRAEPPQPRPGDPEPSQPKPGFRTVVLAEGETLYGLCRIHLGSGSRWKEVAALNGWSEARAGNLRVGQTVKLPLE